MGGASALHMQTNLQFLHSADNSYTETRNQTVFNNDDEDRKGTNGGAIIEW